MLRDLRPLFSWLVDVACRVSLPRLPWNTGPSPHECYLHGYRDAHGRILVRSSARALYALPGDYIVRGVGGEFYPCSPDVFDATYELS